MESGRQIVESGINQLNDLITTLQNGGEVTEEDLNNVITTISQADAALAGVDGMDAAAYQGQAQQLGSSAVIPGICSVGWHEPGSSRANTLQVH